LNKVALKRRWKCGIANFSLPIEGWNATPRLNRRLLAQHSIDHITAGHDLLRPHRQQGERRSSRRMSGRNAQLDVETSAEPAPRMFFGFIRILMIAGVCVEIATATFSKVLPCPRGHAHPKKHCGV
jgi:hypothetical protein